MPGSHHSVQDTSVNKAEKIPSQSLHWGGQNLTRVRELGIWVIILMRVARGGLIESMSKDLKELRWTLLRYLGGEIPPGRRDSAKAEDNLRIPAVRRGSSRLRDCRSEM